MSTIKAFRSSAATHLDSSEYTKVNKTSAGNYQIALKYLQTGVLPHRLGLGQIYSNGFKLSVLNSLVGGSCAGSPFRGSNATIYQVCPGCPQRTAPSEFFQLPVPKKMDAPCD